MAFSSEADLEAYFVDTLARLGHRPFHGATASPEAKPALRGSYHEVILAPVLLASLVAINPGLPERALLEAARKVMDSVFVGDVIQENRRLHRLMVEGVKVTHVQDGEERNALVRLVDYEGRRSMRARA